MVSQIKFTKEINKDLHREFMQDAMDKFIDLWKEKRTIPVLFSKKAMQTIMLKMLWDYIEDRKTLCKILELNMDKCRKRLKRKTIPKSVTNLIDFFGLPLAYRKSLLYNSLRIDFSWKVVEVILAEEFFKAGFSARQVSAMLGIHIRKSFRIQKRLRENGEIN